ncbi:MAG: hypothetical protein FJX59_00395 [Alphaproteobacteria bacterium]|nr:hypothetical protein [Alphaproteobacteria bacterium]
MRVPAVAFVGFAAASLICGDCDVRWITAAEAQEQKAVNEAGAPKATDAEPGYWTNLFTNTMRFTVMHPSGKRVVDVFYNRDKSVTTNAGLIGAWRTEGEPGKEMFCYQLGAFPSAPADLGECFPLRLMNNPRIGAKWGGKMKPDVNYLAEVVAGRDTAPASTTQ